MMVILSGMSSDEQMKENLDEMADFKPLSDSERRTIDDRPARLRVLLALAYDLGTLCVQFSVPEGRRLIARGARFPGACATGYRRPPRWG